MKTIRLALCLCVLFGMLSSRLFSQDITGTWQGTLSGAATERIVLTVSKLDKGALSASIYAADHAQTYMIDPVTYQSSVLRFTLPQIGSSFEGKLSPNAGTLTGFWKWSATSEGIPLNFSRATEQTSWATDHTSHKVSFVTVEPSVKLEVLDWGGTGRPLVLLTGLNDNAHVFDTFAPKLTARYHVYGITRRGSGASDSPQAVWQNYSATRLADDVLAVIDAMKMSRPVLAGHSIAGEELSSIGIRFPSRVAGLIYLDAGSPDALYVHSAFSVLVDWDEMRREVDAIINANTNQKQKALIQTMLATELPRFEQGLKEREALLQQAPDQEPPSEEVTTSRQFMNAQAIQDGEERFTHIICPLLAIFNEPHVPVLKPNATSAELFMATRQTAELEAIQGQEKAFEALGANAHVITIKNADHYIYRSNEADVLKAMDAFIATLP